MAVPQVQAVSPGPLSTKKGEAVLKKTYTKRGSVGGAFRRQRHRKNRRDPETQRKTNERRRDLSPLAISASLCRVCYQRVVKLVRTSSARRWLLLADRREIDRVLTFHTSSLSVILVGLWSRIRTAAGADRVGLPPGSERGSLGDVLARSRHATAMTPSRAVADREQIPSLKGPRHMSQVAQSNAPSCSWNGT
jgi:hypothetical protein